ncbi:hypothetical protein [Pantoea agglomerans]|jgi:hypothetical protein|uniref:primase 1D-like protein n=1 Tax=Enterobacter agglomerans TaxID=549 RepID=UPI003209E12E
MENQNRSPINDIVMLAKYDPILSATDNVYFHFSKYNDMPDRDCREVIKIHKNNLTIIEIERIISTLKENEELSVLSLIKINDFNYHIPMVDFLAKKRTKKSIELAYEIASFWNMTFNIFDSGRSIHAYGTRLLSQPQWLKFMGYLLLQNEKSGEKVVDVRWIGHRLISGFASLRITNNSGKHKAAPKYIGSTTK